jgi:hypothetical protein
VAKRTAASKAAHGLTAIGVDFAGVELLSLFRVAHDVEGCAHPLEPLLRGLVTRVGVRVMLFGELAKRLPDLVGARAAGDAQLLVGIARQRKNLSNPGETMGHSIRRFGQGRKPKCDIFATLG